MIASPHRTPLLSLAALAALIAIPAALGACGSTVTSQAICTQDGKTYEPGDTFTAPDGCNTCTCDDNGNVGCTELGCSETCLFQGVEYQVGETFPASDCGSCSCEPGGIIGCDAILCGCSYNGMTYGVGQSFPDPNGCATCVCQQDGSVVCEGPGCAGCVYNGVPHTAGETFPAGDGCNTCTCGGDGLVACTDMACPATCTYAGATYQPGESFPALDGCNTCTCGDGGAVGCTKMACACDPMKEWWRDYVSTDPAQCMVIDFGCPPNTTAFENSCGCGCEQDPACPQFFDCMPPAMCDVNQIKEQCPFSGIAF